MSGCDQCGLGDNPIAVALWTSGRTPLMNVWCGRHKHRLAKVFEIEGRHYVCTPAMTFKAQALGLWWAATTITTVGYGDRYPTTTLGRLIAVGLMLIGIALLGVVTATIAGWFIERLRRVQETVTEVEERTEATIDLMLLELRELRERLDTRED